MLPAAVKEPLAKHLDVVRRQHQRDLERGMGRVALPNALERKYLNAGKEWGWQWVFPATSHFTDKVTGERHRHHLHESVLQKALAVDPRQRYASAAEFWSALEAAAEESPSLSAQRSASNDLPTAAELAAPAAFVAYVFERHFVFFDGFDELVFLIVEAHENDFDFS